MNWGRKQAAIARARTSDDDQIVHQRGKVYVNGRLVYDEDQVEDQTEFDAEQELRLNVYGSALEEMAAAHHKYASNYNLWQRWDKRMRLWWIDSVERQAQAGHHTIGVDVVSRAVEIRLTRSFE